MSIIEVATAAGVARAHLRPQPDAQRTLLLGHGAGGSIEAPDLRVCADVAAGLGWNVALVEQPYRVAGKRTAPRAPRLDEAWVAVAAAVASRWPGTGLVFGGRSSGARVACRTSNFPGVIGVLALAFPLLPPGKRGTPEATRLPELAGVGVAVLVVQGANDPFGVPAAAAGREVVVLPGDHSLKKDPVGLAEAARRWLGGIANH